MKKDIEKIFREILSVQEETCRTNLDAMARAAKLMTAALKKKKKILFFGNGGSAADSQHWAAELVGRFRKDRRALPAVALTTDTSILTAVGNDYDFKAVFARQIAGLGRTGDVAVGISTSGRSPNVLAGLRQARKQGLRTIGFTGSGPDGKKMSRLCDVSLMAAARDTARIQEAHTCMAHAVLQMVDREFRA